MRYWLYKINTAGGPAGWSGDWEHAFTSGPVRWGGHQGSRSAEVHKALDETVNTGDVVVAYQTDRKQVIGFLRIAGMPLARSGVGVELELEPIHKLANPFDIHTAKRGTVLAHSTAVNGMVMLRELERDEYAALVRLSGAPAVLL